MTERTHVPRTTLSYIYTICVFLGHNMCFFWVRIDGIVGAVVAVPSSHGPRRTMSQVSTLCYNCYYFSVCGNVHTFNKNFVKHPVNTLKQKPCHTILERKIGTFLIHAKIEYKFVQKFAKRDKNKQKSGSKVLNTATNGQKVPKSY